MAKRYKIVVFVPKAQGAAIRQALGEAGAGRIGAYLYCSFTSTGVGRFLALEGARPAIGAVGELAEVEEERIEMVCEAEFLSGALRAVREVHPYEEPAIDVYPIEFV